MKKQMYLTDIDTVIKTFELAKKKGKKPGEDCTEEFFEVLKQKNIKSESLGTTDQSPEMFIANLRENGFYKGTKILDLRNINKGDKND